MNNEQLQRLVDTFFSCPKEQLVEIFRELLGAVEAENLLAPGGLMSRNYETAQANPEIHSLPGNLKDARDAVFPFFWGTDSWSSPLHLENVKGPTNYASMVGALACLLKNPNLCVDTYCLRSNELEVKAITALANLIFYHTQTPWGVFTMGGTISNLYAGKIGIEKVCPGAMQKGLSGQRIVGLVSDAAHYSNKTLAGWLGIGTQQLISIPTDPNCSIRLDLLRSKLDELYREGVKVAFVIATFGTTDAFGVDDLESIHAIIHEVAEQHSIAAPHLHVDAAVGWTSCFLTEYDLHKNPLQIRDALLPRIQRTQELARGFRLVDSVTIDFHKMGWGHYPSSAFIVNRREDLQYLLREKQEVPYFVEADYRHDPALFTLECSRPALGPYCVMASLNGIGLQGYQMLVARAMELADYFKQKLETLENCKVLNADNLGPHVVFWVLPKGRDAKQIYRAMLDGSLKEESSTRYFSEMKRLFDKRQQAMDPKLDARLSYTSSVGFKPSGHSMPAWKAVFFHPATTEANIDRIVSSIEDLV